MCSKNGLHNKGKQRFALLVAESCYFLCFSFLFTQQCSQFVVAYFLVLTVGTFVHTFCSNLIRLIVCVSPCGLVRFNYVVIVVSANVFVFVSYMVSRTFRMTNSDSTSRLCFPLDLRGSSEGGGNEA